MTTPAYYENVTEAVAATDAEHMAEHRLTAFVRPLVTGEFGPDPLDRCPVCGQPRDAAVLVVEFVPGTRGRRALCQQRCTVDVTGLLRPRSRPDRGAS